MHNIGLVSDRRWHDSLSMKYIEYIMSSSMRNSSYIVHKICVIKTEWGELFGPIVPISLVLKPACFEEYVFHVW